MWTCVSILVPRSSMEFPMRAKAAFTAEGSCAATAWVAASKAAPVSPPFWCRTKTAKMSPKSIPVTIRAMPPKTSNRRAPMAGNVAAVLAGIVVLAILLGAAELRSACTGSFDFSLDFALGFGENGTGPDPCPHSLWLICGFGLRLARPEGRHYMLGEHVLCLHALPVLQPAKVGDDRQFTNSTFFLQRPYLLDDFFRRADEADLLIDDFVIG